MDEQIVTISFFTYSGWRNKWQAFARMGRFSLKEQPIEGLTFYKLLGSGSGNGFSIFPDFGTYAFLGVWKDENTAEKALTDQDSPLQILKSGIENHSTIYMKTMYANGKWHGQNPFKSTVKFDKELPLGVITRGAVRLSKLYHFWKFVPRVSRSAHKKEGMIFSKGIGELPLIEQATFSLWKNSQYMLDYAYKSKYHEEVVRKTKEIGWYKEDLFARFYPYRVEGHLKQTYLKALL